MTIRHKPELEELIQQDVERGAYQNADEFLERAVRLLHGQEEWLEANRDEIRAKVEAGYASARRGELMDDDQVRAEMETKKHAWRAGRPGA